MANPKCCIGLASVGIFAIGIWLLGSVPQAAAETLNFKGFNHVTKSETVPIADVEGHVISVVLREGVMVFENGEWAWIKATLILDFIKGAGPFDQYATVTFLDGSTTQLVRRARSKPLRRVLPQRPNGLVPSFMERVGSRGSKEQ